MTKQSLFTLKSPTFKVGLFCLLVLVSACRRTDNPDDVTIEFWTALIEYDLEKATHYSTEESAHLFNENLRNASLQVGRVRYICDGATVETYIQLQSEAASSSFQTILIRDESVDQWKVDYPRTLVNISEISENRFKNIVDKTKEAGKTAGLSAWTLLKKMGNSLVTVFKSLKGRLLR
jgi:hypothetical protein